MFLTFNFIFLRPQQNPRPSFPTACQHVVSVALPKQLVRTIKDSQQARDTQRNSIQGINTSRKMIFDIADLQKYFESQQSRNIFRHILFVLFLAKKKQAEIKIWRGRGMLGGIYFRWQSGLRIVITYFYYSIYELRGRAFGGILGPRRKNIFK